MYKHKSLYVVMAAIMLCLPVHAHAGVNMKTEVPLIMKYYVPILPYFLLKIQGDHHKDENTNQEPSKILEKLQLLIEGQKVSKDAQLLEVSIMLKYDAGLSKQEFVKLHEDFFEGSITDMNGFGIYSFFAKLTPEQINDLSAFEEVSTISTIDDVNTVY